MNQDPKSEPRDQRSGDSAPAVNHQRSDDPLAAQLRGFGPLGILAILIIYFGNSLFTPLSAVLVLMWVWLSHTPWREIGFVRPRSWVRALAVGIVFGIALKLFMKAVMMPLFGAPPINQAFHYLVGNSAALPGVLYAVIVGAAFGEETFFRGYLFERFRKLFGAHVGTGVMTGRLWLIVLLTSVWFGLEHYSLQGLPGVQQALVVGFVFGTIFAITRQIFMLMIAHAAFDIAAVAIIYWDLESQVAHFFIK